MATRPRAPAASVVGRERETQLLQNALQAALVGRGGLVLVAGEAGIGKTTLVRQVAEEAGRRGALVLSGHCYDIEATPSFGPWQELLRDYRPQGELPPAPPPLLDGAITPDMASSLDELRLLVRRFLAEIAAREPLLLVLEDMHWADPASLDLLRALARQVAGQRILIVATYRDVELTPSQPLYRLLPHLVRESQPARVVLRPLDQRAVRRLLNERYRLAPADADRLADLMGRTAEGNPFFVAELLTSLEEHGTLSFAADAWALGALTAVPVPLLVRQVIAGRLERAATETRRMLHAAAVIGHEATLDLWRDVVEAAPAALAEAIREAVSAQVLDEVPGNAAVRFRHALIRQALYEELPMLERQSWHRRAAETLESRRTNDPERIAYHYWQAHDRRGIPWLIRAGERAQALYAPEDAITLHTRAVDLAAAMGLPTPVTALHGRGAAQATTGAFEAAQADFTKALSRSRTLGDRRLEWQILTDLGKLWSGRDYAAAGQHFHDALAVASQSDDPAMHAHSLAWLGNWHLNAGHLQEAIDSHQRALGIAQAHGDLLESAAISDMLATDYLIRGDLDQAALHAHRAVETFSAGQRRRELAASLIPLIGCGGDYEFATEIPADPDIVDAAQAGERALTLATTTGWRAGEAFVRMALASHHGWRGSYDRALPLAHEALSLASEIEHREWTTLAHIILGEINLDLLLLPDAERHLRQALALAARIDSPLHHQFAAASLALTCVATCDLEQAGERLASLTGDPEWARTVGERGCWRARAELALADGDPGQALEIVDRLIASAPNGSGSRLAPPLGLLRGKALMALGRLNEAEAALVHGRTSAEHVGCRPLLWRIDAALGETLQGLDRHQESQRARARAQDQIATLGKSIPDPARREIFLRQANHDIGRPAAPAVPANLTPRELEVLRLAARGLTNEEIAARLFISNRTVKGHLQAVYGKLDLHTRTAATAFAFEHGLIDNSATPVRRVR